MTFKDPQKAAADRADRADRTAYHRDYYRKNRDKKISQGKKRYVQKREEILEQKRDYHSKNKEKINKRYKKYRESSQGKAVTKQWRKENSKKLNAPSFFFECIFSTTGLISSTTSLNSSSLIISGKIS